MFVTVVEESCESTEFEQANSAVQLAAWCMTVWASEPAARSLPKSLTQLSNGAACMVQVTGDIIRNFLAME